MKPKIIQREGHPKEVTLIPAANGNIFTGIARTENGDGAYDAVGRGILLDLDPIQVELIAGNPERFITDSVTSNPRRAGAFILAPLVTGIIYETITKQGELVDSHKLEMNSFMEYAPYNPPKIVELEQSRGPQFDLSPYTGQWVAFRDGQFIAANKDPQKLQEDPLVEATDTFVPGGTAPGIRL